MTVEAEAEAEIEVIQEVIAVQEDILINLILDLNHMAAVEDLILEVL